MAVRIKSYAKLNLTLFITGVSGGYHQLESLVCSVDIYDLLIMKRRKDDRVNVYMHGLPLGEQIEMEQNNAYKAANLYIDKFKSKGVDVEIFKNIPIGAGLGGSSADAAGVLRGMTKLYGLGSYAELEELAAKTGSDTAYMLTGGNAVLSGRGEICKPLETNTKLHFLLLLPKSGVSSRDCFLKYDEIGVSRSVDLRASEALLRGDKRLLGESLYNALYKPASQINGDVQTAYEELKGFSPLGVSMTGSGSGVFALFENEEYCRWAKSRYRGKFECLTVKSVIPKI